MVVPSSVRAFIMALFVSLTIVACGGGGGGGGGGGDVATYSVGGTVGGLTGSLILRNNGTDNLTVSSNGGFVFATPLNDGSSYNVTVLSQPAGQLCTVSNGSGTLSGSNVVSVSVACSDTPAVATYSVGGSVSGLAGSLVLQNNGSDALVIADNGVFTFATKLNDGSSYNVTVSSQPAGQSCSVSSGSGTLAGSNVNNVAVTCSDIPSATYSVGGSATGLAGTLVLQNNGTDNLAVSSDGGFVFSTALNSGSSYNVSVMSQPSGQTCSISNGSGTISANVSNVQVNCTVSNIALTNLGIKTQSPSVVVMPIHAMDKNTGLSVHGLVTDDFLVKEDGVTVGVESFVSAKPVGDVPYVFRIVVAMDVSSSILASEIETAKTALQGYVNNLQPNQELAIYTFDDVVTLVQNFTSDKTVLTTAIGTISRGSPSTNLYGAIQTGAAQWADSFTLSSVTYGALVVITDGDDTSGLVSKTTAQSAVLNKQAYVVPVGAAVEPGTVAHQNLVDIFGASRVLSTADFSVLTNTLDTVRSDLLETFAGLYYVYYASPSRSGTHTIELSVVDNGNTGTDSLVTGSFSATGFSSVVPTVLITGGTTAYVGEPISWSVETQWSNDPANYSWSNNGATGMLDVTSTNNGSLGTLTGLSDTLLGDVTVTITDNNWDKTASKVLTLLASRAPADLTATNSGYQQVSLTWSAVTEAIGYKVYWDTDPAVTTASNQFTVTANSATQTGLPSGQTYYYRVATLFDGQVSGLSAEQSVSVTVPVPTLSLTASQGQNELSWNIVGDATYRIYWSNSGTPTSLDSYIDIPAGQTTYVHTNLNTALPYYYSLVAIDGAVSSELSVSTDNSFSVGGAINGLSAAGLQLELNGADVIDVLPSDVNFVFPNELIGGAGYSVVVLTQPNDQTCTVTAGAGQIVSDVADVSVSCENNYFVSGTVAGLTRNGLVLQNNNGDDLTIAADGAFDFPQSLSPSTAYNVTVLSQPAAQTCTVTSGTGVSTVNVDGVTVDCVKDYPLVSLAHGIKQLKFSWTEMVGATHYKLMENRDGVSGYTQVGADIVGTAVDVEISVHWVDWDNASYVVAACDAAQTCFDSDPVYLSGGNTKSIGYFKPTTVTPSYTGQAVAVSDDGLTMVVGSPQETTTNGRVTIYAKENGTWVQQFSALDINFMKFGNDVAISADGNVVTVGIPTTPVAAVSSPYYYYPGKVNIYHRNGGVWSLNSVIESRAPYTNFEALQFGAEIALSDNGNVIAIGAVGDKGTTTVVNGDESLQGLYASGAVYIYTRADRQSAWVKEAYVKASNAEPGDNFGDGLALSADGGTLAVGATGEMSNAAGIGGDQTNNSINSAGAVYVYEKLSGTWTQQAYIKSDKPNVGGRFGRVNTLALTSDGSVLAIGDPNIDNTTSYDVGVLNIYNRVLGAWTKTQSMGPASPYDQSREGSTVEMSGNDDYLVTTNGGGYPRIKLLKRASVATYSEEASFISPIGFMSFGTASAVSSDASTLVFGAPREGGGNIGIYSGLGYVSTTTEWSGAVLMY